MSQYGMGGLILIVLALLNVALRLYLLRSGRVSRKRALPGLFAAIGFIGLGVVYATNMVVRYPAAPVIALSLSVVGFIVGFVIGRRDDAAPKAP